MAGSDFFTKGMQYAQMINQSTDRYIKQGETSRSQAMDAIRTLMGFKRADEHKAWGDKYLGILRENAKDYKDDKEDITKDFKLDTSGGTPIVTDSFADPVKKKGVLEFSKGIADPYKDLVPEATYGSQPTNNQLWTDYVKQHPGFIRNAGTNLPVASEIYNRFMKLQEEKDAQPQEIDDPNSWRKSLYKFFKNDTSVKKVESKTPDYYNIPEETVKRVSPGLYDFMNYSRPPSGPVGTPVNYKGTKLTRYTMEELAPTIKKVADKEGINPKLLAGMLNQESSLINHPSNEVGATGIAMLRDIAIQDINQATGLDYSIEDAKDPVKSIEMMGKYISLLKKRHNISDYDNKKTDDEIITAYNSGGRGLNKLRMEGVIPYSETQTYSNNVNKYKRGN